MGLWRFFLCDKETLGEEDYLEVHGTYYSQ